MHLHHSILAATALLLASAGALFAADGPTREDLSAVTLQHGETFVPAPGHPSAGKGYIFRFATQGFALMPKQPEGVAFSTAALVDTMRKDKTGDLYYAYGGGKPVLMVVSGKARELGLGHLFEFGGKELEKPGEWPAADPAKGVPISGWIVGPSAGQVYLIETVDGKLALLRVVARGTGGMQIQWILAADGAAKFAIPGGMTMAAKVDVEMPVAASAPVIEDKPIAKAPAPTPATMPAPEVRGIAGGAITPSAAKSQPRMVMPTTRPADSALVPYLSSWMRQRTALLQERLAKVEREGKPGTSMQDIAEAIRDIGKMQAPEAVSALVEHITFLDASANIEEDSMVVHPAVGALVTIGKPASTAALRAIHDLARANSPREAPEYRTILLMNVVMRVEGQDVAEFLFKRELAKADEEHRPYFEQCLRALKRGELKSP